jgi:hypothetical protein
MEERLAGSRAEQAIVRIDHGTHGVLTRLHRVDDQLAALRPLCFPSPVFFAPALSEVMAPRRVSGRVFKR